MIYVKGIDLEAWKYSCKNKTKYICEDLIKGTISLNQAVDKNPVLLMNYTKLKNNLNNYNLDKTQVKDTFKLDKNLWIFGPPGIGKTEYAKKISKDYYIKNQTKWWDLYKGQKTVILDDYNDPSMGYYIKIWADNSTFLGETKGGTIPISYDQFIVTSNYMPLALWPRDSQMQIAVCRRFNFISVEGKFPDFTPIEIQNPNITQIRIYD